MSGHPINQMVLSVVRCTRCEAKYGECDCWDGKPNKKGNEMAKSKYTDGKIPKFKALRTVADLKKALEGVPDKLPLRGHFGQVATLVWFNVGMSDEHLAFDEK